MAEAATLHSPSTLRQTGRPFSGAPGHVATQALELEFGSGLLLYSFYVIVTVLLRAIAGLGWVWNIAGG